MKAVVVLSFIGLGILLFAVGIFGMIGEWTKILFIDLTPLRQSLMPVAWVFGGSLASWFVAGIVMKTK